MMQIGVIRNVGFEKGKVVGEMDRAPSGWVRCRCGFESSPSKSSARRPSVGVYVPASRIDRENAKVNAISISPGEVS